MESKPVSILILLGGILGSLLVSSAGAGLPISPRIAPKGARRAEESSGRGLPVPPADGGAPHAQTEQSSTLVSHGVSLLAASSSSSSTPKAGGFRPSGEKSSKATPVKSRGKVEEAESRMQQPPRTRGTQILLQRSGKTGSHRGVDEKKLPPVPATLARGNLPGRQVFAKLPNDKGKDSGGKAKESKKDDKPDPKYFWGLPKLVWVIIAVAVAMTVFLACIPIVLSCAKRRRPIFR